jgi:hypothetical protein
MPCCRKKGNPPTGDSWATSLIIRILGEEADRPLEPGWVGGPAQNRVTGSQRRGGEP